MLLLSLECPAQVFRDAIKAALAYKNNSTDIVDEIMRELEVSGKRAGVGWMSRSTSVRANDRTMDEWMDWTAVRFVIPPQNYSSSLDQGLNSPLQEQPVDWPRFAPIMFADPRPGWNFQLWTCVSDVWSQLANWKYLLVCISDCY